MKDDELQELSPADRALATRLRRVLRESERLSPPEAHRLARARADALAQARRGGLPSWMWAPGGAVAAAVLVAMLLHFGNAQRGAGGEGAAAEALEVLTDEADPEMYEDLELYRWLAQENGADA